MKSGEVDGGIVTVDGTIVGLITLSLLENGEQDEAPHDFSARNARFTPASYDTVRASSDAGFAADHPHLREHLQGGQHPRIVPEGGGQVSGGGYGRTGGSEANFLGSERARAAGIESGPGQNLTTVQTKAGNITVNKSAAGDMGGFVDELVEAGAPVGSIGSYANRNIAGSERKSQHAYGGAMDLFNQSGRGIISKAGMDWIKSHPEEWRAIKQRHNMVGGEEFGDIGHVEWGGPGYGTRHYGGGARPATSGGGSVRGSYFDDQNTATGLSAARTAGIALPSREGLGQMYEVTGPNGQTVMLPQIDVGPAKWTGRGVDISKAALGRMGYTEKNFPTDAQFTVRPAGKGKTADTTDPNSNPM